MEGLSNASGRAHKRVMWVLGPLFMAVGIVAGSMLTYTLLKHAPAPNHTAAPAPAAGNPANAPPLKQPPSAANHAAADTNTPADAPTASPSNTRPDAAPKVDQPPPIFRLLGAEAARVRSPSGAFAPAGEGLAAGDVLRVERGEARLASARLFVVLGDRGEAEIMADDELLLLRGRAVLRVLGPDCRIRFSDTTIVAAPGEYIVGVLSGVGQLDVLRGGAHVTRDTTTVSAPPGRMVALSGSLQVLPIEDDLLARLRAEADACVTTLLYWGFENGYGDCDLGRIVEEGAEGQALRWDPTQVAAGTSRWAPLFKAVPGARLRLWVLTEAEQVEVTARMHTSEGVRPVGARLSVPAGEGWRMIDVPLELLQGGRLRDQPGLVEGAEYSGLQFSVPPSRDKLLLSTPLAVDEVRVYALR